MPALRPGRIDRRRDRRLQLDADRGARALARTTSTVRVTDNGAPALSDFETFTITVNEVNVAPVLAAIGNKTRQRRQPLTFTADGDRRRPAGQDADLQPRRGGSGRGSITASGVFTWTPTERQGRNAYT